MNPFTAAINDTGLRGQSHNTNEQTSYALAVLLLAEQLEEEFTGVDYYSECERLLASYGVPEIVVRRIATNIFASRKQRLQRGL